MGLRNVNSGVLNPIYPILSEPDSLPVHHRPDGLPIVAVAVAPIHVARMEADDVRSVRVGIAERTRPIAAVTARVVETATAIVARGRQEG